MNYIKKSLIFLILAGLAVPLLRYTSLHFSPITNNSIRFLAGGLVLLTVSIIHYKSAHTKPIIILSPKKYFLLLCSACLMSINMVFFIKGLSLSSSFTGSMFNTFGIPITTLIASIFYQDEREKTMHLTFFIGMIICLTGSFIFISQGESSSYSQGTIYLSISVVAQVLLNNLIKYLTTKIPILLMSTINSLSTGSILMIIAVSTGSIKELTTSPFHQIIILIFAGIYGITVGQLLGFNIIKQQGISTFNILQLLTPIVTAVFSYFFMKENISQTQIFGAMIILCGAYLCIFGRKIFKQKTKSHY